jgi:hypothetical protein
MFKINCYNNFNLYILLKVTLMVQKNITIREKIRLVLEKIL